MRVFLEMGEPSCSGDEDLSCPPKKDAVVVFSVSALLDYAHPLQPSPSVRKLTATSQGSFDVSVPLPELAPGRHCVLLAIAERPNEVVHDELPSHGAASLFSIVVGQSRVEHCAAPPADGLPLGQAPDTEGGCVDPVLSIRPDEVYLDRSIAVGDELWLFAPSCRYARLVSFLQEGQFADSRSRLRAFRLEATESSKMIALGPQEVRSIQAVAARASSKMSTESARLTQPVLLVPP